MRRVIVFLILLALAALIGLVIYGYVSDLPAPAAEVSKPAAGVGFSD